MSSNNIIDFASKKIQMGEEKYEMSDEDIHDFAVLATFDIVDSIAEFGIHVDSFPESIKDILLLTESIKSVIYRSLGESYQLHETSDTLFNIGGPEELSDAMDGFMEELDNSREEYDT
jgi:hypothetical protein